jgi:hypothetical protein
MDTSGFASQAKTAIKRYKRGDFSLSKQIANNNGKAVAGLVQNSTFVDLQGDAYADPKGYSIKTIDGEKVMFVAGTRNLHDWADNFIDTFTPHHYRTKKAVQRLNDVAKRNGVDVVVGHSRGAGLVGRMDGKYKKLGLDGAMMINPDKNMMNVSQDDPFDRFIAQGGKNNHFVRWNHLLDGHRVVSQKNPTYHAGLENFKAKVGKTKFGRFARKHNPLLKKLDPWRGPTGYRNRYEWMMKYGPMAEEIYGKFGGGGAKGKGRKFSRGGLAWSALKKYGPRRLPRDF